MPESTQPLYPRVGSLFQDLRRGRYPELERDRRACSETNPCDRDSAAKTSAVLIPIYIQGWGAYFRICDAEGTRSWKEIDAHVRRRIRAIVIRQQKRPRFLFRHLDRKS